MKHKPHPDPPHILDWIARTFVEGASPRHRKEVAEERISVGRIQRSLVA